jgi:hypothetical protein
MTTQQRQLISEIVEEAVSKPAGMAVYGETDGPGMMKRLV